MPKVLVADALSDVGIQILRDAGLDVDVNMGRTEDELNGNSDKILLIEIPNSDIPWTEPRDVTFDEALDLYRKFDGFSGVGHRGGLHYVTSANHVHQFSEIRSVEEFAEMLKIRGGKQDRRTEESHKAKK